MRRAPWKLSPGCFLAKEQEAGGGGRQAGRQLLCLDTEIYV